MISVLLLLLVQQTQRVEDEVGVAECLNAGWELFRAFLKFECAAGDLDYSLKPQGSNLTIANCIDDTALVKFYLPLVLWTVERQYTVQTRIFDYLHRVEDADRGEISGEREVLAFELCLWGGRGFQVRAPGATNCFEAAGDVYSSIKLLGFEQSIVRSVKVFSLYIKTGQGETLARSFFDLFVSGADLAQTLAQFDRTAVHVDRGAETLYGAVRRLVFHEELGIEQGCFDVADVLGL